MKNTYLKFFAWAFAAISLAGCASSNASYVDSGGPRTVISTNKINMADWNSASAALVNDLLSSGALDNLGLKMPIKMLVSRVKCDVGEPINRDLLTNRICMALNNSGKVVIVVELKLGNNAETRPERIGEHARASGGSDQRERL